MRSLRSAVLLLSTAAVIGCQTAGSMARPAGAPVAAAPLPSPEVKQAESRPAVATKEYSATPVAEPGRRRTIILVAIIVAAAIVAAVLISGGDGIGGGY